MMQVYLTGFEPFGSHRINASWEAVKGFSWDDSRVTVHCEQLPVDYQALRLHLPERLHTINPDVILHLGVMSPRGFLRLETGARNHIGATLDNAGYRPASSKIDPAGPDVLTSVFPLNNVLESLQARGLQAQLSEDAGSYLCNFSYYLSLAWAQKRETVAAFLHVPVLGQPFSVEQLREAIQVALEAAVSTKA